MVAAPLTPPSLAERLASVEVEVRRRHPRPSARLHISLSNPPIRTVYQTQMRVAGKRDDVLDYVAALYEEVKARADGWLPIEITAIEKEEGDDLQLLVIRDLHEG